MNWAQLMEEIDWPVPEEWDADAVGYDILDSSAWPPDDNP